MPETDASRLARLEERSAAILRDIERLTREVETFAPIGGQLIELIGDLSSLTEDFVEFKNDLKAEKAQRIGMSTTVKVALISGTAILGAALIAAVASIVAGQ